MDGEYIAGALLTLMFWFIAWVVVTIVFAILAIKNAELRIMATLIGLSFPTWVVGYIIYSGYRQNKVVKPGEHYSVSDEKVRRKAEIGSPLFDSLCKKFSVNENEGGVVTGFRLQVVKPLKYSNAQARGWNSAIDFYSGTYEVSGRWFYSSITENLQATLPRYMSDGVFEFQGKDGGWNRLVFDKSGQRVESITPTDIQASHGIVVEQEFTGYENSFTIYQVSIRVYELASNKLIARNVGLFHDGFWGVHNNYQLVPHFSPDGGRCRGNEQSKSEEYVARWLSSISKK